MHATPALTCALALLVGLLPSAQEAPQGVVQTKPIDWIYVIDTSLTMLGKGKAGGQNIFADVKNVMRRFLADDIKVGDTVRIVPFDSDATVGEQIYIGSESAKDAVGQRIERLDARGQYTNIANAVHQVASTVAAQPPAAGRTTVAVIFTDGINEPPPSAKETIDLTQALRGFPVRGAFFYFINLGSATNDLGQAFEAVERKTFVLAGHNGGLRSLIPSTERQEGKPRGKAQDDPRPPPPTPPPTLAARWAWILWPAIVLLVAAAGGVQGYRWWTSPPVEGTLLVRLDDQTHAMNLKQLKASRLMVGRGGSVLAAEPGFRIEIAAFGTRGRVERITATLLEGSGTLNTRPLKVGERMPLRHDDAFRLARVSADGSASKAAVVTYQNFRLQKPGSPGVR